jgi:hypothetical protein
MEFLDWMDQRHTFNRQMHRGVATIGWFFRKEHWWSLLQIIMFLVMSPVILFAWLIGAIGEWRENRRDGIRSVDHDVDF